MKDNSGSLYIFDAILAVILLLAVILAINSAVISIPPVHYSESVHDFKIAQDVMETLSGKVNSSDRTFLADISIILAENNNSKESVREVSDISKNKFDKLKLTNYRFAENSVLEGKVLASCGDYNSADNISQASRTYGDYLYTLSVW